MESFLMPTGDGSVTVPGTVVKLLIQRGDGDAALLYLTLLRHNGTLPPRALAGELRWQRERMEAAETVLRELKLLAPSEEPPSPEPPEEKPAYTRQDITQKLEISGEFRSLTGEVERRLGERLSTQNLNILLGLYDYLGLPADVIYLLVCHCVEKTERRLGAGRRPGMRQIEREGYTWARLGIDTQAEATAYLKKCAERSEAIPQYMRVLRLPERPASPSEEKYMTAWQEMGFPPETVAEAYDKTILHCQELKWPYLNGILKRWHTAGLHTPEEVREENRPAARPLRAPQQEPERSGGNMRRYIEENRRKKADRS
jgi:DnaD/phage-associated family protein